MLIGLTDANNKSQFFLYGDMIRVVQRHPQNELTTLVVCNIMGPQGPLAYEVLESPQTIAAMLNGSSSPQAPTRPTPLLQA